MMKKQISRTSACAALVVTLVAVFTSMGTSEIALAQEPGRAAISPLKSQTSTDYLVQMEGHVMWESQVGKMHPELIKKSGDRNYPVQIGKHSMPKSQVGTMHPELAKKENPNVQKASDKDYPVQVGKHVMQKSQVGKMHPELVQKEKSAAKQANSGDYPVQVNKHVMQKSQVGAMHPELIEKGKALSEGLGNDFMVQFDGVSVLASTLRRVDGPNSTRPAALDATFTDYLVRSGEKTVWASDISTSYPTGPHKGEQQPLYLRIPF